MEMHYKITEEHVLRALERIKKNDIPPNAKSTGYDLIYNNEAFPPKYVLSIAYDEATGRGEYPRSKFHGGAPTNSKLKNIGFQIVKKSQSLLNLNNDKLLEKALKEEAKKPKSQTTKSQTYVRGPAIAELTKRHANGICDLCEKEAPFTSPNGPYLECHHIVHLAKGGPDELKNTVALCPNCHRKMHVLDKPADRKKLTKKAKTNR